MPRFTLDANIFIEAKNKYYPLDIFTAFWDWLDQETQNQNICSSSLVYQELIKGEDNLADWVKDRYPSNLFPPPNEAVQQHFGNISEFVVNNYTREEADDFLAGADPWVIAQGMNLGSKIVTMEKLVGTNSKKVKIPNVCNEFNLEWCNTFEMLRELGARF